MHNRIIPTVIVKTEKGTRSYDVYSMLLQERIIFVNGTIDDEMANDIIAQLFYLEQDDPTKDIYLYIDSPGGSVIAGWKIIDTLQLIKPKVGTLVTGLAASMGATILSFGEPGMRKALPNASIMLHMVSAGNGGHVYDMEISMTRTREFNERLMKQLANNVGMTTKALKRLIHRDRWLTAEEALKFGEKGMIDSIVVKE